MPRHTKPDWSGQHLLPGCAGSRSRIVRRHGKRAQAETIIVQGIIDTARAKWKGLVVWIVRTNAGFALGFGGGGIELAPAGFPDIACQLVDGRSCLIEVKCPGEDLEPHQRDWKEIIEEHDGVHILAHSKVEAKRGLCDALGLPFVWTTEDENA